MKNIITNGIKRRNPSYLIVLHNANVKNDIKIIGKRLLKNKNNARAPRNTYDVSVIPKNELLIILGSIMKNVEPIIAYFVGTNLVHKRYTGIIVKTEITTVNMRWM